MGHIVGSAAAKATALGYGDQGMMLADVVSVLPYAGKPVNAEALLA